VGDYRLSRKPLPPDTQFCDVVRQAAFIAEDHG
jgi:hypothetical protein